MHFANYKIIFKKILLFLHKIIYNIAMTENKKICAIVGAGDFIGAAIAKRFATEGYLVFAGRRNGEKLLPLKKEIESTGGQCQTHSLDARDQQSIDAFFKAIEDSGQLEICIFNVGGNVYSPFLKTTEQVFKKVWEMCAKAGFLTAQAALPQLLEQGSGSLFFTGATASVKGNVGYSAFSSGKFALRALTQSLVREFASQNIHIGHLIIDSGVDTDWVKNRIAETQGKEAVENLHPDRLVKPESIAEIYWQLHCQNRDCWTYELDIRSFLSTVV